MTIPTLIFSGLCVVAGAVVFILTRDSAVAMTLFALAGAGGTGVGVLARRGEIRAQAVAAAERERADHWQEQTQTLLIGERRR